MSRSSGAGWRPDARISEFNRPVVEEFRAGGGRVGGMFEGADLLLLTTVGARTGLPHTVPLADVTTADPERFRADLDRMAAELGAHLDYEEEQLIPLLAKVPFPPSA